MSYVREPADTVRRSALENLEVVGPVLFGPTWHSRCFGSILMGVLGMGSCGPYLVTLPPEARFHEHDG